MTPGEEDVAFFYELGVTITTWSSVETSLFEVVSRCVHINDRRALATAFFSIENFRSKLDFADALIESTFANNPHLSGWQKLVVRLKNAAANRNKLAHNRKMIFSNGTPGRRYAIVPWTEKEPGPISRSKKKPPPGALCVRDIAGIRFQFASLLIALNNLSSEIVGQRMLFPKSSEQVMSPPMIRAIKNRIHEVLGHPPKPSRRKP